MAQRRSLSGRSPLCQQTLIIKSQCHWENENIFLESNNHEKKRIKQHQPHCSLPESAGGYRCSLFLGQLDQGLVGNAESTHVNRPRGKAAVVPEVWRCCKI